MATKTLRTSPLGTLGVEIHDLDLRHADPATLQQIDALYRGNSVMLLRGQTLTPAELVAFAGRFGDLLPQTKEGQNLPGYPGICVLSNKIVDGRPFGFHKAGRRWHTDGTTQETPGLTTVLYGLEIPPEGGDTLFADACAAYNSLPADVQGQLEDVRVVHSLAYLMQGQHRRPDLLPPEELAAMHDILHPLVLRNPVDGRKTFYLTMGSAKGVVGMSDDDGRALMRHWIDYATQDRFVYRHRWHAGDVLIWNDVSTLHLATDYDDTRYERLVYRCWMTPAVTPGA
jgi:taurine dioxygenase